MESYQRASRRTCPASALRRAFETTWNICKIGNGTVDNAAVVPAVFASFATGKWGVLDGFADARSHWVPLAVSVLHRPALCCFALFRCLALST